MTTATAETAILPDQRSRGFSRRWYRTPSFVAGLLILGTLLGLALAAPLVTVLPDRPEPAQHPAGASSSTGWAPTSSAGRVDAAGVRRRVDLKVGFLAVLLPFLIGTVLGSPAGFYGGKLDTLVAYFVNVVVAFPSTF
jgi:peptide/nickel transport system permease protein